MHHAIYSFDENDLVIGHIPKFISQLFLGEGWSQCRLRSRHKRFKPWHATWPSATLYLYTNRLRAQLVGTS